MDFPDTKASSAKIGGMSVVLLALLSAAVSGVISFSVATSLAKPAEIPFVVLDSSRLLAASIAVVRGGGYSEADAMEAAALFSDSLNAATGRFVAAGYVVLNKGIVIGAPVQLDITDMVAHELGLTLE